MVTMPSSPRSPRAENPGTPQRSIANAGPHRAGRVPLEQDAIDACLTGVEGFVGVTQSSSSLDIDSMFPPQDNRGSGDRSVGGAAHPSDAAPGNVTGTADPLEDSAL